MKVNAYLPFLFRSNPAFYDQPSFRYLILCFEKYEFMIIYSFLLYKTFEF